MEQADVPEEGDSLVGGWGRRALSSARTSPARRLINARKLACTFHMEKMIQKTASHSKLEKRNYQAYRAHAAKNQHGLSRTLYRATRITPSPSITKVERITPT